MPVPLKVEFDRRADAAYIYLLEIEPGGVARTVRVHDAPGMLNLDFDTAGRLIGIEVLPATHHLPQALLAQADRI
jgi:uncharacterized protein YuzE